ncbi:hypothetical protein EVAR_15673_1 [Eumeta japonica]|uniref:Uncharacterized protein n=1 Tax=Eumeta variegata TaxID=151549 RepID=A0A4C1U9K3_EUMVA|nr:hypothetical protein EVAR_15673_1 [Eumeta japonica]
MIQSRRAAINFKSTGQEDGWAATEDGNVASRAQLAVPEPGARDVAPARAAAYGQARPRRLGTAGEAPADMCRRDPVPR